MIIEDRDEKGRPKYRVVCVSCGTLRDWGHPAIQMASEAIKDGWNWKGGDFYCKGCATGRFLPRYVAPDYAPEGAVRPEYKCQHCGKATKSLKKPGKKCPKCKGILWPKD